MAKKISIVSVFALIFSIVGCKSPNSYDSYLLAKRTASPPANRAANTNLGEISIIELVEKSRQEYKQNLETLMTFYDKAGNHEKQVLVTKELDALNTMPQYDYVNPLDYDTTRFSATVQIPDADLIYEDAMIQKQEAEKWSRAFVNKDLYRSALYKFKQLIKQYNNSDKIDDAAYQIGFISEYFKDYTIALQYYEAAYTWDPLTPWPARFHAARILDKYMHNYAEALPIYREAIIKEGTNDSNRELKRNAEERIAVIEKTLQ